LKLSISLNAETPHWDALGDSIHSALALEFLPLLLDIGLEATSQPMRQSAEVTGKITPGIPDLELSSEILPL
jgi:hypothetical protein